MIDYTQLEKDAKAAIKWEYHKEARKAVKQFPVAPRGAVIKEDEGIIFISSPEGMHTWAASYCQKTLAEALPLHEKGIKMFSPVYYVRYR